MYDERFGELRNIYISRSRAIEAFNLSEEKVTEYEENIETACYLKPGEFDFLIEMQKDRS